MSQLVPCPGCERHVRLSDSNCPFCSRELDVQALGAAYAPRRKNVNAGIKRAALFALGTGMAAACGGKTDGTGSDTQPVASSTTDDTLPVASSTDDAPSAVAIYGAPVPPNSSSTVDETTINPAPTMVTRPTPQPPYGAPIPTTTGTTTTFDDDSTYDEETTEILGQPEYGAPIPTLDAAIYGAPVAPISSETLVDAGVEADAGDAGVPGQPTIDPGPDPTPQPVYGSAPVAN